MTSLYLCWEVPSWDGRLFGHNRHGPKIGGCAPFGGAGSPCNTVWPGPRHTCMPSLILIRPTIWPQYTNVIDRQDSTGQTDNSPIAYGEPLYKRSSKNLLLLSQHPLPSNRHHRSCDDCLEGKGENYIVCNNCAQCDAHTYEQTNSSLDWVLSHWAHYTVLHFCIVYYCVLYACLAL